MIFAAKEAHERKVRERARAAERECVMAKEREAGKREEIVQEILRRIKEEPALASIFAAKKKTAEDWEKQWKKGHTEGLQEGRDQERKRILKSLKQNDLLTLEIVQLILDDWVSN